jgi:hypothetical protein
MILNLRARIMCIAKDSTQSHTSEHTFRVGTHGQLGKKPHPVIESMYKIGVGLDTPLTPICVVSYRCTDSSGDILTYSRYPTKLRWWLLCIGSVTCVCHLRADSAVWPYHTSSI